MDPCLVKLLNGRGGIGFLPLRGTRRARSLRSLGSNPREAASSGLPRGYCSYGRGGIRTHEAGLLPTRSPGVRLSPLGHPSKKNASGCAGGIAAGGGGGIDSPASQIRRARSLRSLGSNPRASFESPTPSFQAEGVGFEPTRLFRVNALAGRRLKPLGHPSAGAAVLIGPPGLEPGIFWSRARRVANSTTGQRPNELGRQ